MAMVEPAKLRIVRAEERRPYEWSAPVEEAVAYLVALDVRFASTILPHLDADGFKLRHASLVVQAAQIHFEERGSGPGSFEPIIARLDRWHRKGDVDYDDVEESIEMFEKIRINPPDPDAMRAEIAPMLRRLREMALGHKVVERIGQYANLQSLIDDLQAAQRIGVAELSIGTVLGDHVFDGFQDVEYAEKLRTGIPDFDVIMDGGLGRGEMACVAADTGVGKTHFLVGCAAEGVLAGHLTCAAVLEGPEQVWVARVISRLTGVPTKQILRRQFEEASRSLKALDNLGPLAVKRFPENRTTWADVKAWVGLCETQWKRPCRALVVDYPDRLGVPTTRREVNTYEKMGTIYSQIHDDCVTSKRHTWLASQLKSGHDKLKGTDKLADSKEKGRILDVCVLLTRGGESRTDVYLELIKVRNEDDSIKSVGPFTCDLSRSAISVDGCVDLWRSIKNSQKQ